MGRTLWFYYPNEIDHYGGRVTFRGVRWRRTTPYLLAASAALLGVWFGVRGVSGNWHPSPLVAAVSLATLGGVAWIGDITRYSLTLDGETKTYELIGGWPWSKISRRGDFEEVLRLRLGVEQYPRRSWAVLSLNGKWLVPRPAWGHRGWLVLYLDIQGDANLAFQLQCSAFPQKPGQSKE